MQQQPMVRKVMPPHRGGSITLAQAKRAWLEVMREEREAEEHRKAERRARRQAKKTREADC